MCYGYSKPVTLELYENNKIHITACVVGAKF